MESPVSGGCHCGGIRYEASGELGFSFACFCDSCRKLGSGARLTAVGTEADQLTLSGVASQYTYKGGKDEITLVFCPTCGTQIYALPAAYPDRAIIRVGTLDDPSLITRVKAIFAEQAMPWDSLP